MLHIQPIEYLYNSQCTLMQFQQYLVPGLVNFKTIWVKNNEMDGLESQINLLPNFVLLTYTRLYLSRLIPSALRSFTNKEKNRIG